MKKVEFSKRVNKKFYESPKLVRQGHISLVTAGKTGPPDGSGMGIVPHIPRDNSNPQFGSGSVESADDFFFDNYYDE